MRLVNCRNEVDISLSTTLYRIINRIKRALSMKGCLLMIYSFGDERRGGKDVLARVVRLLGGGGWWWMDV